MRILTLSFGKKKEAKKRTDKKELMYIQGSEGLRERERVCVCECVCGVSVCVCVV